MSRSRRRDPGRRAPRHDDPDPRWSRHGDLREVHRVRSVGVLGVAFAFGLSLLCAAYLFGHISGCHINPAVTIGDVGAQAHAEPGSCPSYFIGQILGALLGGVVDLGDPRDR